MEPAGLPWRVLRPLLLAGAAATAWLTLSAPAASADSASDPGSLLGSVGSSVSSITDAAINPVEDVLAAAVPGDSALLPAQPGSAEAAGLLQPLTGAATGAVDHLIEAVPVVNQIVPSGTVGTVTAPVTAAADGIVTEIAQEVFPVASDAPAVLDPVVEPVSDLLTGVDSIPGTDASIPDLPVADVSAADGATTNNIAPTPGPPARADAENARNLPAASAMSKSAAAFAATGPETLRAGPVDGSLEDPLSDDRTPDPAALPAVPGSGSGNSQSQGGGAGGTVWLSTFTMDVPLTGALAVCGPLQSPPAPVSFDPGSSPD